METEEKQKHFNGGGTIMATRLPLTNGLMVTLFLRGQTFNSDWQLIHWIFVSIEHSYFHSHYSNRPRDLTRCHNGGTGKTGVFIMAQSLVPARAKVDLFPSALCVRLTWIGLWCRGQVGTELLGSQRGIKDKPLRRLEHSGRFILVTIYIQKINDFPFHVVYKLS